MMKLNECIFIDADELLEKYNGILNNVSNIINKELGYKPIYH